MQRPEDKVTPRDKYEGRDRNTGRWLPGHCPNPGGMPKSLAGFRALNREIAFNMAEQLFRLGQSEEITRDVAMAMDAISKAMEKCAQAGGFPTVKDILMAARTRASFTSPQEFDRFVDRITGEGANAHYDPGEIKEGLENLAVVDSAAAPALEEAAAGGAESPGEPQRLASPPSDQPLEDDDDWDSSD